MSTCIRVAVVIGLCASACVSEDPIGPDDESIPQGLTIFTDSPADGLTAMYAEGIEVVFLETVRTVEPQPSEFHHSFLYDGTAVNIDVRFSDIEGRDLIVSLASDDLPLGWDHGVPQYSRYDIGRRAMLGGLIQQAAAGLRAAAVSPEMEAEVARVELLGSTAPLEVPTHQEPERPAEMQFRDYGAGWFYRAFEIHKKWIGWPIADHSASQWWNCEATVGCYGFQETSNHGSNSTTMSRHCSNVSPWIWQGYMSASGAGSCDWYSGYSACGLWGGNHNCHDDSKFQRNRVLGCGSYSQCSSGGCDTHAPDYCGC